MAPVISMAPLYALSTLLMLGYAAIFTLLAQLRTEFGFSVSAIGAIAAFAFVAGFVAQFFLSRLADAGHGRAMMRAGLTMTLVGLMWMCVAETLWAWIAARTLLGFGAGCIRPRRPAAGVRPRSGSCRRNPRPPGHVGNRRLSIGPVFTSVVFAQAGLRAPFAGIALMTLILLPFVWRVNIPGAERTLPRAMRTLLRRPAMQACIAMGVAFYVAVGAFDTIWAVFMADLGASQVFIGVTMSLFTLPMLLVAPWAGGLAARRHVLDLVSVSMTCAMLAMLSYGFIGSIWWICVPVVLHAVADAVTIPAIQLGVGYASGEEALGRWPGAVRCHGPGGGRGDQPCSRRSVPDPGCRRLVGHRRHRHGVLHRGGTVARATGELARRAGVGRRLVRSLPNVRSSGTRGSTGRSTSPACSWCRAFPIAPGSAMPSRC